MKNLVALLCAVLLLTSCGNDDNPVTYYPFGGPVILKSQAEVDYFVSFKPGSVQGDITIGYTGMQSDITDISGMSTLSGITGKLTIINNPLLTSLQGLENLEEIQGNSLVIHNNASLTSIEELKNLTQDQGGDLEVTDNPALTSLEGLQGLTWVTAVKIANNNSLQNINGLRSLDGDVRHMIIAFNPQIENLLGLEEIDSIELLDVNTCIGLKSCLGLDNCFIENLYLSHCPQFNSFESMANVTFGSVIITDNSSVSSLAGLNNFTEWNELKIYDCPQVTSLQDLNGTALHNIELHNTGITSLQGLENLEIDTIILSSNNDLETLQGLNTGYTALKSFTCTNNGALQSMDGMMHVSQIDELRISNNSSLANLDGLQNLTKAIYIWILGNASLESIEQLESLTMVGRDLEPFETTYPWVLVISGNNALETLDGIGNITSLKGFVEIMTLWH